MKRRGFTKKLLCERTGFDHKTVNKVFAGDPGVAIGTYLKVMAVLGMESNFADMAVQNALMLLLSFVINVINRGCTNNFPLPEFISCNTPISANCFKYVEAVWRFAMSRSTRLLIRQ